VQWMWRLLISALLCVPAIFMLVAGAWNDRRVIPSEPRYGSDAQLFSSTSAPLTITLPKAEAGLVGVGPDQSEMALNVAAPVDPPPSEPQRTHSQHPKLGLWYAATPKQETPAFLHWRLTNRPGVWVPGPNQDGGG
jgi:hypothetical protein